MASDRKPCPCGMGDSCLCMGPPLAHAPKEPCQVCSALFRAWGAAMYGIPCSVCDGDDQGNSDGE